MKEGGLYQAKTQLSALVAEVAATGDGIALSLSAGLLVGKVINSFFQSYSD